MSRAALCPGAFGTVAAATTPGTTFSAADMPVWYDPATISTLFQTTGGATAVAADGDPVGTITDRSGNARTANTAANGQRPLYKDSGGVKFLQYDGVDDYLRSASGAFTLAQTWTLMACIRLNAWATGATLIAESGSNFNASGIQCLTSTPQIKPYCGASTNLPTVSPTLGTWYVLTAVFNVSAGKERLDGGAFSAPGSQNMGSASFDGIMMGGSWAGGIVRSPAQVDVAQMFAVNRALTAPEDAAMLTYMGALIGKTL